MLTFGSRNAIRAVDLFVFVFRRLISLILVVFFVFEVLREISILFDSTLFHFKLLSVSSILFASSHLFNV